MNQWGEINSQTLLIDMYAMTFSSNSVYTLCLKDNILNMK